MEFVFTEEQQRALRHCLRRLNDEVVQTGQTIILKQQTLRDVTTDLTYQKEDEYSSYIAKEQEALKSAKQRMYELREHREQLEKLLYGQLDE